MTDRVRTFLHERADDDLRRAIERLANTDGVERVAIMPDAHVAEDVCVGAVVAARDRIFPDAVGGDIGCGMSAIAFDADADAIDHPERAAALLAALYARVPTLKHRSPVTLPSVLETWRLSADELESQKRRTGRIEFGTLGRGNHFLELQRDDEGRLWLMVHTGSRAMGPLVREHHKRHARRSNTGLAWLAATGSDGEAYRNDAAWACAYARENRRRIVNETIEALGELFGVACEEGSRIESDHNHVRRETHGGLALWVHRKGAMGLSGGELGVVPGSMATPSYHVRGAGANASLHSCSHGAGRRMSRAEARRRISHRRFEQDTQGVWFDARLASALREESPAAYKDIDRVMDAQRDLVRIVRRLDPVFSFKGV